VDNSYACCAGSPDLSVTQLASTNPAIVGHNLTYAVSITNLGSSSAGGVLFTDILPGNVTFVSASPGCTNTGGTIVCAIGTLPGGGSTNVTITVSTTAGGLITNAVSVSCANPDSNSTNNSASLVTGVDALPVITVQPVSRTVLVGTNVSFDVTATGVPPPDYQWLLNGTNLPGETAGVLTLTNVQPAQAGDYTVTVTNAVGVTNSTAARLIVLVPPAISSINLSGTNILISLPSVSGLHYTLEYKTTLDDPDWLPLPPAVLGTGGVIILTDDTGPFATRFYRVRCE
jgi:uncharacterized repeat protein (TIGR01451 family)